MPPKRPEKIERDPEVSSEQLQRAFSHRLLEQDPEVDIFDKEAGVLRSVDGSFLSIPQIQNLFIETMQKDCGFNNNSAWHVHKFQVSPLLDRLRELRTEKNHDEAKKVSAELVRSMHSISTEPESYGIDIKTQDTPRHELRIDEDEMLALLQDEENVPDPLYVNGQLPMPKPLGDAFRRIFEKLYPENDETIKRTVALLKERCVEQLVRQFVSVESMAVHSKEDAKNKRAALTEVVESMTRFMRDALNKDSISVYVQGIETGNLPTDAVQFASITRRPSFDLVENTKKGTERRDNIRNFYKHLSEKYSEQELEELETAFDTGNSSFFRDEAGPKTITHIYYDCLAVMKKRGVTEDQLQSTFLPYIKEMIKSLIEIRNKLNKEYKKGFARKQSEIDNLKIELGMVRRTLLRKGKEYVDNPLLSLLTASETISPDEVLSDAEEEQAEVMEDEFAFTCVDFSDIGFRSDALEAFKQRFEDVLQPLRSLKYANELNQDDSFIELSNNFKSNLVQFAENLGSESYKEEDAIKDSNAIIALFTSLRSRYENYQEGSVILNE